jgi:hypothetical protein
MTQRLIVISAILLIAGSLAAQAAAKPDPIDAALAQVGLTRQTGRVDRDAMNLYGGDRYRLQLYDLFMDDPYKMPDYVPVMCRSALANCNSIGLSVMFASLRVGAGVRRGLLSNPVTDYEKQLKPVNPLAAAIAELDASAGQKLDGKAFATLQKSTAALPESLNRQLALLVTVSTAALGWRNLAFSQFTHEELKRLYDATLTYLVGLDADTNSPDNTRLV